MILNNLKLNYTIHIAHKLSEFELFLQFENEAHFNSRGYAIVFRCVLMKDGNATCNIEFEQWKMYENMLIIFCYLPETMLKIINSKKLNLKSLYSSGVRMFASVMKRFDANIDNEQAKLPSIFDHAYAWRPTFKAQNNDKLIKMIEYSLRHYISDYSDTESMKIYFNKICSNQSQLQFQACSEWYRVHNTHLAEDYLSAQLLYARASSKSIDSIMRLPIDGENCDMIVHGTIDSSGKLISTSVPVHALVRTCRGIKFDSARLTFADLIQIYEETIEMLILTSIGHSMVYVCSQNHHQLISIR
jgi:hypothetical protein